MGDVHIVPITVEELRGLLLPEEEVPDEDLGYNVIKPYKTQPITGGTAFLFMKKIKECHLDGQDWVLTNVLHDIYFSSYGSHMNLLIKLAKSKYLETKAETTIIDVETSDGFLPQSRHIRLWRLTEKGLDYLVKYDLSFEEMVEKVRTQVVNYLTKKGIEYEITYPYESHGIISFNRTRYDGEIEKCEFRIEDLARKPSRLVSLRSQARWSQEYSGANLEEDVKFAEAKAWLAERPEIKTAIVTLIGTISVSGDVHRSTMMLNDKRVCVVPSLPVHNSDVYICRLSWLNYDLDNLIKLIVREHTMVECPSCHSVAKWGGVFQSGWIFCPICGAPIDEMVEDYILRRIT